MRRLPNIHLLILTAFSAGVVYMFSGFLEQNYIEEIAAVNSPFRPSDEQTLMARRLNLEHRVSSIARMKIRQRPRRTLQCTEIDFGGSRLLECDRWYRGPR